MVLLFMCVHLPAFFVQVDVIEAEYKVLQVHHAVGTVVCMHELAFFDVRDVCMPRIRCRMCV